ncbi:MAG TPA: aminotransferase class III-fold pyridoxal phosphate-dependent enzyme [Trueperaceae bacterium]|nr:aminotransferase class III-fold pyridoxal phosphate-dependent enzyme [Trueperaceae bacterium]
MSNRSKKELIEYRKKHLGKNLSLSYQKPLKIIRGRGQFLYDENDVAYLDCVNNVCHVGHCHPKVVKAGQEQMSLLNTNTRYLHDNIINYADKLLSKFPAELDVCFFVNSGSEANELALRLAKTYTNQEDIIVIDHAYHGNTNAVIDISPYKFNGKGGQGKPKHSHVLSMPDSYHESKTIDEYMVELEDIIASLQKEGRGIAAFIAEALLGCGGQVELPPNYLKQAYKLVHDAAGVTIADEVQIGFGRIGSHFWGFESQGVVPDIVTMGKPIGNGHPMAAVVTSQKIANAFANGMEYFNTFGGNPVSSAIGLAVLEVIEDEELQANALEVGNYFLAKLNLLKSKYQIIADVRGRGLFIGVELIIDNKPATRQANEIVNQMKERCILLSTDGPNNNVIKIKPPIVFSKRDVDYVVDNLDMVLAKR